MKRDLYRNAASAMLKKVAVEEAIKRGRPPLPRVDCAACGNPVGNGGRKGGPRPLCCACYFRERRATGKEPRLTKAGTLRALVAEAERAVRELDDRNGQSEPLRTAINDWRKAWEP